MSVKLARNEIERFIAGTDPEILCLSGKWGVGKTYSWNYYLKNAKDANKIEFKRYAYVSLFGLKTLDELKYALYEATKPIERVGENLRWDYTEPENALKALSGQVRWVLSRLSKIPAIQNYVGLTESILFYFVGKQLICIDDLERAGSGLDVLDVFGLVSFLKEQRGCRVALLLNEEEIAEEQKSVFNKQFEKVVDTHLFFEPTPEEAADIVFPDPESPNKDIRGHSVKLGIVNIRVIKKIEKIANRLRAILEDTYPGLVFQALHSATVFAWSKYQKDGTAPPFDFLKDTSRLHGLFDEKEKRPKAEKEWQALMAEYQYVHTDEFDLIIHEAVDSGIFDPETILKAAEKQSQGVAKSKQEQVLHEAWDMYHGSFEDNEKEVMDKMYKTHLENLGAISPTNLDSAVRALKEFDRQKEAVELIAKYIEARPDEKDLYDLRRSPFGSEVKDADLRAAFEKKLTEFTDSRDPADVLEGMVVNKGWNTEDEELVDKLSAEDFYEIFKREKGLRFHRVIRGAFLRAGSAAQRALEALKNIAKENRLNAKRVAAQGINIKDE